MKTLTALATASILLISATAANAASSYFATTIKDTVMTDTVSSRDAAYQAGTQKLSSLQSSTPRELSDELGLFYQDDVIERSIELGDNAYVTVQERRGANGEVGYVGVVNLNVSYDTHEDDN